MTRPPAVYWSAVLECHAITASGGIIVAVMLGGADVAVWSLADVSAVSDGKDFDNEAIIFDDAEGAVVADPVAPLA